MTEYRWNQSQLAQAYDAAAEHVHPYYLEIQQVVLDQLPFALDAEFSVIDAGGGSGRLMELLLDRYPHAQATVLDQSDAFLEVARQRLARFGSRASFCLARLQEDWTDQVARPNAILSMSAVHHLEPLEKRRFYQQCHDHLLPGGVLVNGDEVRPESDQEYLDMCRSWASHMDRVMAEGLVNEAMAAGLRKWQERNISRFHEPRVSGDDCHETISAQRDYCLGAGFSQFSVAWSKALWAVMVAR